MVKHILACRIGSYRDFTLYSYEHLSKIEVEYIERPLPSSDKEVEMIQDILDEFNLKISSFQAKFTPLNSDKFENQINEAIKYAKIFDTSILFSSIKVPENPVEKAISSLGKRKWDKMYEKLHYLGEKLGENGLKVCLETHPNLVTNGKIGLETMQSVNQENVCINFDTANMYYYNEGIDAVEELKLIKDYVGSVHLKDSNKKPKTWYFPALGDGNVDFPAIISVLDEIGFKGPYTMEIEGIEGEKLNLEQTKERIKRSVEYMRSIGDF